MARNITIPFSYLSYISHTYGDLFMECMVEINEMVTKETLSITYAQIEPLTKQQYLFWSSKGKLFLTDKMLWNAWESQKDLIVTISYFPKRISAHG